MLNIGMTELLVFGIIALLVLGPEKLPEGARFAAKWYGKFKRLISSVQSEIDRELRLSEFREEVQKEIERITELERRMQQQIDTLRSTQAAPAAADGNAAATADNRAAHQTAGLGSKTYQPLASNAIPPFSSRHIQRHWPCMPPALEVQNPPVKLKIAV